MGMKKDYTVEAVLSMKEHCQEYYELSPYNIDDTSLSSETLLDFAQELKRQMRGVKFGPSFDAPRGVYNKIAVYYEEDDYIIGNIGFGDFTQWQGTGAVKYMVESRLIQNERFNSYSDQYTMLNSKDMKRMVREAKKYLRRWNPAEVAALSNSDAAQHMRKYLDKYEDAEKYARAKLLGSPYTADNLPVLSELEHLIKSNHEFATPTLRDQVLAWITARDEAAQHQFVFPVQHVNVIQRFGRQIVNILSTRYKDGYIQVYKDDGSSNIESLASEDVPLEVANKIAVLSMVASGDYVEEIGYKHNETTYWLHV